MNQNKEKGDILEDAVHRIEACILNSKPGLAELPITIEQKKICIIDGVRHEIDIYAEIDHGHGYKTIVIFECKNWANPVGKNEIVNFSEKIKVLGANQGFFVANKFTSDAQAQAKLNKKMELIVSQQDHEILKGFPDFHIIEQEGMHVEVSATERGYDRNKHGEEPFVFDFDTTFVIADGEKILLKLFLQPITKTIVDQALAKEPTSEWPEGSYNLKYLGAKTFTENQLLIDDRDIARIELDLSFTLKVKRPIIRYAFDIEGRGKAIELVGDISQGKQVRFSMVQTHGRA